MIKITQSAVQHLKALILAHPEDPVVRVQVKDLDEHRLTFNLTLEDKVQPDDEVQAIPVDVAVAGDSARVGVAPWITEPGGFKFHSCRATGNFRLDPINLN